MPDAITLAYDQGQFKRLRDKLDTLDRKETYHQTINEVGEFLVKTLATYPEQKSVTRLEAYGVTFFTDRQRRFFFWALANGYIDVPYKRTGKLGEGWHLSISGGQGTISNDDPIVKYVQRKQTQSRMMKLIGWETVEDYVQQYQGEIGRVAFKAVGEAVEGA